jgi:hypothetical protein
MSHKNCLNRLKNRVLFFVLLPLILIFSFTYLLSDNIYAQTADQISLQGKIVRNDAGYEGLNVVNGTPSCVTATNPDGCDFRVKYYDASTSGNLEYTETFLDVEIGDYGGVFNLSLGSGTGAAGTYSSLQEALNSEKSIYIQIEFAPSGDDTNFTEVFTRTALNAAPFAMSAGADGFGFYNTNDSGESSLTATAGAVYYNTTDNELKVYNGTSWVALSTASGLWTQSTVASVYGSYMAASGTGAIGTFDDFTLDLTNDRLSINTTQPKGGLTVYSSYDTATSTAWPLVSFKAEGNNNYDATILELIQDGTGDLLTAYLGSTESFRLDQYFGMHLSTNGVAYFEDWTYPTGSAPTSGDLHPNPSGGEGCIYSYGGDIYWDSVCDGTAEEILNGGSASSLWTQGSGFAYLTTTTDDLVLGASTTTNPPFFFDVSEKRLGIGTGTPQAAIDIAGASSTISNTSGDITITPAGDLVVIGDILLGEGTTTRSLYAYNAAQTYYGQIELYNLATGNMTLNTTFDSGDIILSPGTTGGVGIGTSTPVYDLDINGGSQSFIGLNSSDGSAGYSRIYFKESTSGNLKWGINYGSDSYGVTDRQNDLYFYQYYNSSESFINKPVFLIDNTGNIGIGEDEPSAQLTISGDSDEVQLSVKGYSTQTNNLIEIIKSDDSNLMTLSNSGLLTLSGNFEGGTNNTYDIGNTSTRWKDVYTQGSISIGANGDSGGIRYNTTNNELEFSNDGSTWIPMAGATKTVTLSAEYPGAVLAADGSSNTGFMTSDAEGSASDSMNYYEWNSSETSLQDYDVRLRFTIPSDFASWGTNAFTLNLATETATDSTINKVDLYVYEESSGTVDDSSVDQVSSSAGVWTTTNIQGADLGDCNAAGETCLVLIRMSSKNDNYVRIGDIDINYNRKL